MQIYEALEYMIVMISDLEISRVADSGDLSGQGEAAMRIKT